MLLLVSVFAIIVSFARPRASSAVSTQRYFPETGHTAVNPFVQTWNNTPNSLFNLGYPLSRPFWENSFTEPGKQYRVQYFERAVLEEHPENANIEGGRYLVLGRLMGKLLIQGREKEPPFVPIDNPNDGTRYFPETKHTLADAPAPFATFWRDNGGLAIFGYPLSEQFREYNRETGETYWVQYFERQRMEWHPDEPDPRYRVLLGLLAKEYYYRNHIGNPAFESSGEMPTDNGLIYGFNVHLYGSDQPWQNRNRVFSMSKDAGVRWLRQQLPWMDMQSGPGTECYNVCWGEMDAIVAEANAKGMKLMLNVVRSPSWATDNGKNGVPSERNYPEFARFMGLVANRYRGQVGAYEIWNEQNLAIENSHGDILSPDSYVEMLSQVYNQIKANDPNAIVVSGGLASTETNQPGLATSDMVYFKQMIDNPKYRSHVDALGVHIGGHLNPPDTLWPDKPGPGPGWRDSRAFYFRHLEDIRALMVQEGVGSIPIWVTEWGWVTDNYTGGFEYGQYNSEAEQAQYTRRALEIAANDYQPWVGGMFLWNLNFVVSLGYYGYERDQQAAFSVLYKDWSPRPAYTEFKKHVTGR